MQELFPELRPGATTECVDLTVYPDEVLEKQCKANGVSITYRRYVKPEKKIEEIESLRRTNMPGYSSSRSWSQDGRRMGILHVSYSPMNLSYLGDVEGEPYAFSISSPEGTAGQQQIGPVERALQRVRAS